jgi:transposase
MARYDLPDTAWALIMPLLLPERSQRLGHPYIEHRKLINGMFWVLCSGAHLRDLPERCGSWKPSTTISIGGQKNY